MESLLQKENPFSLRLLMLRSLRLIVEAILSSFHKLTFAPNFYHNKISDPQGLMHLSKITAKKILTEGKEYILFVIK